MKLFTRIKTIIELYLRRTEAKLRADVIVLEGQYGVIEKKF